MKKIILILAAMLTFAACTRVYYWLDKGDYTLAFRLPLGKVEVIKSYGPEFVVRLVKK
jgi:hypothetical protein